jgi:acyl carrier protein
MNHLPRSLHWKLNRAIESGELKRQDDLDEAGDKLTEIFQCDSLDLVELIMGIEEQKDRRAKTVGDLIDLLNLLKNDSSDDVSSPTSRE